MNLLWADLDGPVGPRDDRPDRSRVPCDARGPRPPARLAAWSLDHAEAGGNGVVEAPHGLPEPDRGASRVGLLPRPSRVDYGGVQALGPVGTRK